VLGEREVGYIPLKRVSTVTKYDPMGTTIMARVKPSSFMMTDLGVAVSELGNKPWGETQSKGGAAYVGTAGAMSDLTLAAGLEPMLSSFSRRVFSWEMILRVAMMDGCVGDS
jgi:hypothetical protein